MDVNERITELTDEIIDSLQKLLMIKSVESEARPGMPFGDGVNQALEEVLELADNLGFKTNNLDGYCAYAEIGTGKEMLGILCHLDVVPAGKGWSYPPFSAEIHDGKIYGRGSIDDKGPLVAALYALKAIKDCGIDLKRRVRIIMGTDEESGWKGLEYYLRNDEEPTMAFSPDAEFPVIHGEKGILNFKLKSGFDQGRAEKDKLADLKVKIKEISGGNAPNMVPDHCRAVLETDYKELIREKLYDFVEKTGYNIEFNDKDEFIELEAYGISAHASLPGDGRNAISALLLFLNSMDIIKGKAAGFLKFYYEHIGMDYDGQKIGCGLTDEVSGNLTFNVGKIKADERSIEVLVDVRYPVSYNKEDVFSGIKEKIANLDIQLEEDNHKRPLYHSEDDPLVKKLMKAYQVISGDNNSNPLTIGGGTYARAFDKAVAFGPVFPGEKELAHQKDEYISIDDLLLNTRIYARAVLELAGSSVK